jgi:hypothetical protein
MKIEDIDDFTRHYLIAALWSSTTGEDGDEPLDQNHGLEDIAPETVQEAYIDCQRFRAAAGAMLHQAFQFYDNNGNSFHPDAGSADACAGHDFWLDRNRHGVGFSDRGMAKDLGRQLSATAQIFRELCFYEGDDGKIYSM